jgi:hypothetical protein
LLAATRNFPCVFLAMRVDARPQSPCSSGRLRNIGLPEQSYWTADDSKRSSRWSGHDTAQNFEGLLHTRACHQERLAGMDSRQNQGNGHFWVRTWSKSVYGIVNLLTYVLFEFGFMRHHGCQLRRATGFEQRAQFNGPLATTFTVLAVCEHQSTPTKSTSCYLPILCLASN